MSDSMMMVDLIKIKQRQRVMIFFKSAVFFYICVPTCILSHNRAKYEVGT